MRSTVDIYPTVPKSLSLRYYRINIFLIIAKPNKINSRHLSFNEKSVLVIFIFRIIIKILLLIIMKKIKKVLNYHLLILLGVKVLLNIVNQNQNHKKRNY